MYVDLNNDQEFGPPAGMIVSTDKLQQLRTAFEEEGDRVRAWVHTNKDRLTDIPPPGDDPCSKDTAAVLSMNGHTAVSAAEAYVDRLRAVARKMYASTLAYARTEDENTGRFHREPE